MDETHTVNKEVQKPNQKPDWIRRLSVLTLISAAVYLVGNLVYGSQADAQVVFYPVISIMAPLWRILFISLCVLTPMMFFLVGYFVFENVVNPKAYPERYYLELLSVLAAALIFVIGFFRLYLIADLTLVATTHHAGANYVLAEHHTFDDNGFGTYILYECLDSGIVCTRIYDDSGRYMESRTIAQLVSNAELNTISILIDGETIYTYTPE